MKTTTSNLAVFISFSFCYYINLTCSFHIIVILLLLKFNLQFLFFKLPKNAKTKTTLTKLKYFLQKLKNLCLSNYYIQADKNTTHI